MHESLKPILPDRASVKKQILMRCMNQKQKTVRLAVAALMRDFSSLVWTVAICSALLSSGGRIQAEDSAASAATKPAETLNNASIIKLQTFNLGDEVVLAKIKSSKCNFDTSIEAIGQLKDAKVSDAVIKAMLSAGFVSDGGKASANSAVTGDQNDPNAPHALGVYIFTEVDGKKTMTKIMPESASMSGGAGPFGGSQRAVLNGLRAKLQIKAQRPVFYMYLGSAADTQLVGGKTPAQLPLIKLELPKSEKKKQDRTFVIGSHAGGPFAVSHQTGIPGQFKVAFDDEEIAPGVFKVTPQSDLVEGEYGFANETGSFAVAAGQVFCFGYHP